MEVDAHRVGVDDYVTVDLLCWVWQRRVLSEYLVGRGVDLVDEGLSAREKDDGKEALPAALEGGVGVIGIAGTIYGWWKNQNITSASLAGQQLVDALKKEGVVNGISAAKNAALSAAAAVAKTTPKTAAESAESTDTDDTVADSAFEPGGDGQ